MFENIIHQRTAGCYMLGEENRHYVAFEACSGCAGEAISMSVCLCVGSGMKGYGWACTDRFLRLLVASSDQKPWFTTEQWSDTHSSMREPDRHYWSACTPASTNTPTQTQEGRLWCSAPRLFLLFQRWRRERNSEKKVTCVKPNAAKVVSVRAVYMQNKNVKTATLSRDIFI